MLEELDIRNLGPIREASIAPARGMTAITGETGAGKSMLLSAIRLVSGDTAESSRVAAGADEAWAQAIFALDDDALAADSGNHGQDDSSRDADDGDPAALIGVAAAIARARDAGVEPETVSCSSLALCRLPADLVPYLAANPCRDLCSVPLPENW